MDLQSTDADCSEYLTLILSFCHLNSYYQNINEYEELEDIIEEKLPTILQKTRWGKSYSNTMHNNLVLIFAFNMFKVCCENTNSLVQEKNNDSMTLLEFIDEVTYSIFHQLNILESYQDACYNLTTNQIKHLIIKLLSVILKTESLIFSLENTEFAKILNWSDFKNNKAFINNKQFFKKALVIKHTFTVLPNYHALFKLCHSKPVLRITALATYLTTKFPPFVCNVIKQHRDRPHTTYTLEFSNTLLALSHSRMLISHDLLQKQWELAELDMRQNLKFLATSGKNLTYNNLTSILEEILTLIQTTSKNVVKGTIRANTIKEKAKLHIQTNKTSNDNMQQELQYSEKLLNLKKKWDNILISSIYEEKDRITLQKIFSKYYQYYIFKKFIDYVKFNKLNSWYFLTYGDFRGRFYYDSIASPQSFWGFRHIYKCEPIDFTSEPYYHSIGVLFKKEITNTDGELRLDELIRLGQNKYNALKNLSLDQLYSELKDLTLIAEFLYYTHALTNTKETFFIWKDTTCSMAQHAVKLLGFKENTLKYINLDNTIIAYDTYTIYIRELKKLLKRSGWSETQLSLLTRGLLKHVIMTIGYGVTLFTAYNRHKSVAVTTIEDSETLKWITDKDTFAQIYQTLAEGRIDELFYSETRSDWVSKQILTETFNLPDIKIPQVYLRPSVKLTNLELNPLDGQRRHHQVSLFLDYNCDPELYIKNMKATNLEEVIDKEKTKRALYVNAVHALDAYYMRNLIYETRIRHQQIIAIHDGFAISPHQGNWLISTANLVFNKPNQPFSYSSSILI